MAGTDHKAVGVAMKRLFNALFGFYFRWARGVGVSVSMSWFWCALLVYIVIWFCNKVV